MTEKPNEEEPIKVKVAVIEALDHYTVFDKDNVESKAIIRYIGEVVAIDDNYITLEGKRDDLLDQESQFLTFHILKKVILRVGVAEIKMKTVDPSLNKFELNHYT